MTPLTPLLALLLLIPCTVARAQDPAARPDRQREQQPDEHVYDFTHPIGLALDHPDGWKVQETPLGLQLVPPDLQYDAFGPTEVHLLTMIGADPQVPSLDDRRASQALTMLVQSRLPFLAPRGKAQAVPGRPDARRFDYAGTSPYGKQVECRVYGVLIDGWFVSVSALAERGKLDRREPALVEAITTVVLREPTADPVLSGTWYSQSFSRAGGVSDFVNTTTVSAFTLLPNGRVRSSTQTGVSGQVPGGSVSGVTDALLDQGRWALVGKDLWVVWRDGTAARWTIYLQGQPGRRELLLTAPGGGNKVLWTEYAN